MSLDEDNEEAIMLLADTYMKMKEYVWKLFLVFLRIIFLNVMKTFTIQSGVVEEVIYGFRGGEIGKVRGYFLAGDERGTSIIY